MEAQEKFSPRPISRFALPIEGIPPRQKGLQDRFVFKNVHTFLENKPQAYRVSARRLRLRRTPVFADHSEPV